MQFYLYLNIYYGGDEIVHFKDFRVIKFGIAMFRVGVWWYGEIAEWNLGYYAMCRSCGLVED